MRYMRCKCARRSSWTSMGHPNCDFCPDCLSTLAEGPGEHVPPEPHEWREEWRPGPADSPPTKERVCLRCMRHEQITEANQHALTVWVDDVPLWFPSPSATGQTLKVARRIDPLFALWQHGVGALQEIGNDEAITLTPDARFMSTPRGHF